MEKYREADTVGASDVLLDRRSCAETGNIHGQGQMDPGSTSETAPGRDPVCRYLPLRDLPGTEGHS